MLNIDLTAPVSSAALLVLPVDRLYDSSFAVAHDAHDTMLDAHNVSPQIKEFLARLNTKSHNFYFRFRMSIA